MSVFDISHANDLKPKKKFFSEIGEECINVDACIAICRQTDTPKAKAIYRAFRKNYAILRSEQAGQTPAKIREEAFLKALENGGAKIAFVPVSGSPGDRS